MIVNSKLDKENASLFQNISPESAQKKPLQLIQIQKSQQQHFDWAQFINHPSIRSSYRPILRRLLMNNSHLQTTKRILKSKSLNRKIKKCSRKHLAKSTLKIYQKSLNQLHKVIQQKDVVLTSQTQQSINNIRKQISIQQIDIEFYQQQIKMSKSLLQSRQDLLLTKQMIKQHQRRQLRQDIGFQKKLKQILISCLQNHNQAQ